MKGEWRFFPVTHPVTGKKRQHGMTADLHQTEILLQIERQWLVPLDSRNCLILVQYAKAKWVRSRVLAELWQALATVEKRFALMVVINQHAKAVWWNQSFQQAKTTIEDEVEQLERLRAYVESASVDSR